MQSAALYKNYLNRSGPKHLGAKEIPEVSMHFTLRFNFELSIVCLPFVAEPSDSNGFVFCLIAFLTNPGSRYIINPLCF